MQLWLAPMEGLLDFALRDTLTRVRGPGVAGSSVHPSGIDRCVGEFIRVTDTLLPPRAFIRTLPELLNGGHTASGVPVRGQLLGSDPTLMAENAARLAELGSCGVDLNFGCPAAVVNRHGGGSALLQEPEWLYRIVGAARRAVPPEVPVSAKMRLGYLDDGLAEACAQAIEAGGADEIVVHARTKAQGYRPPAYWERIADIRSVVRVPVVANGEIWSVEDAARCRGQSGCGSLMLGRGMVTDPGLALAIRHHLSDEVVEENSDEKSIPSLNLNGSSAAFSDSSRNGSMAPQSGPRPSACQVSGDVQTAFAPVVPWSEVLEVMTGFWALVSQRVERRHRAGRLKQWLNLLRRRYPEAQAAFDALRTCQTPAEVELYLQRCAP